MTQKFFLIFIEQQSHQKYSWNYSTFVITTETLGKDQKIWYDLYWHAKCRIEANQEKKIIVKEIFSTPKMDNKQKTFTFTFIQRKKVI